jgi:hypothetical protein
MKNIKKHFVGGLLLFGLLFGLLGCIVPGGGGGPWYHDGPWFDGPGWGGGWRGVDVHPPGFRR